jgi:pimeloyl-ACP methyl ester carboxylesterase
LFFRKSKAYSRGSLLKTHLHTFSAPNVKDQLDNLSIPTLIVCGMEDRMTPLQYSEFLRDHIAGARLEVIPNAGHMVMLEQPNRVSDLMADFLNSIPRRFGK